MMIQLTHVEKYYKTPSSSIHALKNINLTVNAGKIFGIIGKSGAGKSTLIRCVNLLEKPSSGKIIVDNQELTTLSATELRSARHKIGMIFQHFNLLSSRTVYQNVALPLIFMGYSKAAIRAAVEPLLELVGLTDKKNTYPHQLSGGQKQRVAIARALASNPKVLLCDEATSALDPGTTQAILALLHDINQRLGLTILLITHEMDVIKQVCDQVALIEHGEIIEQGNLIEFLTDPQTLLAKSFANSCLKQELPPLLKTQLMPQPQANCNPVLRILFQGAVTTEPFVARLIQEFKLELNILQANIEYIKDIPIGTMVFEVKEQQGKLAEAIHYLQQKGLTAEIIGYVTSHVH